MWLWYCLQAVVYLSLLVLDGISPLWCALVYMLRICSCSYSACPYKDLPLSLLLLLLLLLEVVDSSSSVNSSSISSNILTSMDILCASKLYNDTWFETCFCGFSPNLYASLQQRKLLNIFLSVKMCTLACMLVFYVYSCLHLPSETSLISKT